MSLIPYKLYNDRFYAPLAAAVILKVKNNLWMKYLVLMDDFEEMLKKYGPFAEVDDDYVGIFGEFYPAEINGYNYEEAVVLCRQLYREIIKESGGSLTSMREFLTYMGEPDADAEEADIS